MGALTGAARRVLEQTLGSLPQAHELADTLDGKAGVADNNAHTGSSTFQGTQSFRRLDGKQGTAHVAGDWALSAGFGSTASVAVKAGSRDTAFGLTITAAGTGEAANPTAVLTFKDGAFPAAPFAVVCRAGGSQRTVPVDVAVTTTTLTITFLGTPVAAETYSITGCVFGG